MPHFNGRGVSLLPRRQCHYGLVGKYHKDSLRLTKGLLAFVKVRVEIEETYAKWPAPAPQRSSDWMLQ